MSIDKRRLSSGRQNEVLFNEEMYKVFNVVKHLLDDETKISDNIMNKSIYIDNSLQSDNGDMKFYNNGNWELLFKNRFKITEDLTSVNKPTSPINGQLWINKGVLYYYNINQFTPVKALTADNQSANVDKFKDFLCINPVLNVQDKIIDNITEDIIKMDKPVTRWKEDTEYLVGDIIIIERFFYKCKENHNSGKMLNYDLWDKVIIENQFLLPDTDTDKFFIDGLCIPQKTNKHNKGYTVSSSVAISYPSDENLKNKVVSGIHVNPGRLTNIIKRVVVVDKTKENMVIEIPEENTEFYGVRGGYGKLLLNIPSSNVNDINRTNSDYISVGVNGMGCIQLSKESVMQYDLIYAITYEFEQSNIMSSGSLWKNRFELLDNYYVNIGKTENSLCVFLDGLFLEPTMEKHNTYHYDEEKGFLIFDEELQQKNMPVKKYELSVLDFPYVNNFSIGISDIKNFDYYYNKNVYKIQMNPDTIFKFKNFLAFVSGIGLSSEAYEVVYDPEYENGKFKDSLLILNISQEDVMKAIVFLENKFVNTDWKMLKDENVKYIDVNHNLGTDKLKAIVLNDKNESMIVSSKIIDENTIRLFSNEDFDGKYMIVNIKEDLQKIYGCIVAVYDEVSGHDMWRGRTIAKKDKEIGSIYINIHNETEANPKEDSLLLKRNEDPIVFVDGIYIFQQSVKRENDKLTIKGLQEGQEVILLADTTESKDYDQDSSDRILFEDYMSYTTVALPNVDSVLVYVDNSIICDASVLYDEIVDKSKCVHGQVFSLIDEYGNMTWNYYDARKKENVEIKNKETLEALEHFSSGYTNSPTSMSLLQHTTTDNCVYYAYKFCDNIEQKLQMGYCYPNNEYGVDKKPFSLNYKHTYAPGRNELSVYFNGIKQNLMNKTDKDYLSSNIKEEVNNGKYFYFSDSKEPLDSKSGYYTYKIFKDGEFYENKFFKSNTKEVTLAQFEKKLKEENKTFEKKEPRQNVIFYTVEPCEKGESKACLCEYLNKKNSLNNEGAYPPNCYRTKDLLLTAGHLKVFINGLRQPYGEYERYIGNKFVPMKAFSILNQSVLKIENPLLDYFEKEENEKHNNLVINEILIETREDFKIKEKTIPAMHDNGKFYSYMKINDDTISLPDSLFKTKDKVMIYINGHAYGSDYFISKDNNNRYIELLNKDLTNKLTYKDMVTFEWR